MGEDDAVDLQQIDVELDALPEGVRAEIDQRVVVQEVAAPAAQLFAAEFLRLGADRTLAPQRGHPLRRRRSQKSQLHRVPCSRVWIWTFRLI